MITIVAVQVVKRVLIASKLQCKEDFESVFFLSGGIRLKIKAHTNNGVVEGKAVDIRDDLVLDTEKVKFILLGRT
ncbi:hypothetical protein [Stygiolobus sp. RP850M]|uniref:hypothetical protein n=1 Tax=Stygiolobus sp. RP850M TaxID=3133137 RepID=UPI00307F9D54